MSFLFPKSPTDTARRQRLWITVGALAAPFLLNPRAVAASQDSITVVRQSVVGDSVEWIAFVAPNSGDETYLRYLQIAGRVARHPWSLRGFSQREARDLSARIGEHPWTRRGALTPIDKKAQLLPLTAQLTGNSAFPHGINDGAVWAGRGLTVSVAAGFALRAGPISMVAAPIAFVSQNASFDLLDNGQPPDFRFADGLFARTIDMPQRFGDRPYGRVDAGNSSIRVDLGPFSAGVSTVNQAWGPFELYPFILGTNAPGFLHGFLGTSRPVNIGIGTLHGRVFWGRLDQSAYSPVEGEDTYVSISEPGRRRFGSGLLALLQPRGVPGLEIGIARFFHSPWPRTGIPRSYFLKPFEDLLKAGLKGAPGFSDPGTSADNQLVSGFGRWAFPTAGFEMYAEYGREDHSWDKRDFVQEPDHSRSYALGIRKTLRVSGRRMDGITVEVMNSQIPHLVRTGRGEGGIYSHGVLRQGHTQRGQLLGSGLGVDAAGSTFRWDAYTSEGRTTFALQRNARQNRGSFFSTGAVNATDSDVQYSISVERLRRIGNFEIEGGLALTHEFNRNFLKDASNVSGYIKSRILFGN